MLAAQVVHDYFVGMEKHPIECRVALNLPRAELDALDDFCRERRRATGDLVPRSQVIRDAIREYIQRESNDQRR